MKDIRAPVLLAVSWMTGTIVVFRARRTKLELRHAGLDGERDLPCEGAEIGEGGATLSIQSRMAGHTRAITSMFFTEGQDRLVSTSVDMSLRIWSVANGQMVGVFSDSTAIGVAACLPICEDVFVTANGKAIVRMINSKSGQVLQKLKVEDEIRAMAFDSDGRALILGSRVGTLHALECVETKLPEGQGSTYELFFSIHQFKLSKKGITCITYVPPSPDQPPRLLVNTTDSAVAILDCIYDKAKLAHLSVRYRVKVKHTVTPLQSCYSPSPDGFLVSGSEDHKVYICNLTDYRIQHLHLHKGPVVAVAVNSQNTMLASADSNGMIAVWRRSGTPEEQASAGILDTPGETW